MAVPADLHAGLLSFGNDSPKMGVPTVNSAPGSAELPFGVRLGGKGCEANAAGKNV